MRVARFSVTGRDPQYGIVELPVDDSTHPNTVAAISGDPFSGPVHLLSERYPLDEVRLLAPVIPRSKVIGVGGNYLSVEEYKDARGADTNLAHPDLFFKPNTSVIGPADAIVKPSGIDTIHYEGELAVVIGRICRHVPLDRVQEVIFGYTCANDVTADTAYDQDGNRTRSKGWDTFCPIGPWITTHLKLAEAGDLTLHTSVDGTLTQESSTRFLRTDIAHLVCAVSEFTTLLPGDIILTGTPEGCGPVEPGSKVDVEIEEIGVLSNPVVCE